MKQKRLQIDYLHFPSLSQPQPIRLQPAPQLPVICFNQFLFTGTRFNIYYLSTGTTFLHPSIPPSQDPVRHRNPQHNLHHKSKREGQGNTWPGNMCPICKLDTPPRPAADSYMTGGPWSPGPLKRELTPESFSYSAWTWRLTDSMSFSDHLGLVFQ